MKISKYITIVGISFILFVSGCSVKTSPKPKTVQYVDKNTTDHMVDNCEDYGNLKKAVAKLIVNKESGQQRIKQLEREIKQIKKQINNGSKNIKNKQVPLKNISSSCVGAKPPSYYIKLEENDTYYANKKVNIRICPYPKSKIIGFIKSKQIVRFKTCNRFGWCELLDRDGFVAGNMFTSRKTKKKVYSKGK